MHRPKSPLLAPPGATSRPGDFTADGRVVIITAMAGVVGTLGALSAWVLLKLIALVTNLVWYGTLSDRVTTLAHVAPSPWVVVAPTLGGVAIGLMARCGSDKIRGHGIPEAIEAILAGESRMSPKVALLKPLSSALSIGTGGPFGAEGPIIMTGGALGSLFAQFFHLTSAERKTLLVAGAAAGMTAIFGSPMASVLLAVELLLFEWKPRSFIPVVAGSVVAAAWRPLLIGSGPLFPLTAHPHLPPWGLAACLIVGALTGLTSGALTRLLYAAEDAFDRLPLHWMWWPTIGGLVVGLGGLIEPRALGVGYDVIGDFLSDRMGEAEVWRILLVKSLIWVVALASGTSGGVLAPLLILGGALGWLEGSVLPGGHGFWALLGMAAMIGGTMRAPLTGVIFAIEITGNLAALLPLLTATGAAYAVTVLLLKRSILTEKIARRGQHITREYAIDPFELMRARDVMVADVETLPADMTINDTIAFFSGETPRHKSYPVVADDRTLIGMVSRTDALKWHNDAQDSMATLGERIADQSVATCTAEDVLGRVADLMAATDHGRIPVVDPKDQRVVGLVARKDLLRLRTFVTSAERDRAATFRRARRQGRRDVSAEGFPKGT
jgi:H+/Cl- antiporter ClcA